MKVVIAANGPTLDSPVAKRFGHAPYYLFWDSQSGQPQAIDNTAPHDETHAVIARLAGQGVEVFVTSALLVENLHVEAGGERTLEEMVAGTRRGLLLTCLWYIREVDAETLLLTGLTRDGVYVVRDGEVVGSAGNFRFNESPLGMLARVSDAGSPEDCLPREWADWFTRARVAPLAVEDFNLSTTSEAV